MSEENKKETPPEQLPAFVKKAPELLPLWDWWVKEGKSTVTMLIIAGAVVAAFYGVRGYLRSREAAANAALVNAYSADDLEAAVSSYGSSKVGPALKLRLAKAYYDAERYQDALETYEGLVAKADKMPALVDIAEIGRAYALEGLAKYKEAGEAYAAFANDAAKTNSYLALTAKLGSARCTALAGDKDGAVKALDALKAALKDDKIAETRIERLTDAIKRYEPGRSPRSLFDAADAAEKALATEAKPAAPAAPAPAAKPAAPAPAAKPAAPAPAAKPAAPAPAAKPAAPAPAAKPAAPAPAAKPAAPAPAAAKPAAPAAKPAAK